MNQLSNEQIQVFLAKAIALSVKSDETKTHLDLWFYQMMMSQLKQAIANPSDIIYLKDMKQLSDIDVSGRSAAAIVYDSGDQHSFIPDAPDICVFKRLTCLALIKCDVDDFIGSAPFQLGIDINRHTLASFKGKATHFLLPFDILLYVEKSMLDKHGSDALSTNLFNQDGYLFSPHVMPSIITGFLTQGNLSDLTAFVAQPNMLRSLCLDAGIDVSEKLGNADLNEDVLLSLKVFKYRYHLPINPESMLNIEQFESALQSGSPEISVKIGGNEVHIIKPPRH